MELSAEESAAGSGASDELDAGATSQANGTDPVALSVAAAALPLMTTASISVAAASPSADAFELGGFTIWGIDGYTVTAADFSFDPSAKTLTVNTDARFATQNADQAKDASGNLANAVGTCLVVPAGRSAHIRFEGVSIKGAQPVDIKVDGELTLVLGDGTKNKLVGTDTAKATLHCPTGAALTIDDSVLNRTSDGRHITPEDGKVPFDC